MILLLLGIGLMLPPGLVAQTARDFAARGDSLMGSFQTERAIAAYRAGLADFPNDKMLLWKTSRAIFNYAEERPGTENDEERYEEAVELARRAAELSSGDARAHATLAAALGKLALFRGGRRKVELAREVKEEAELATQLDPSYFGSFVILGILNRELATLNFVLRAFASTLFGGLPDVSIDRSAAMLERAVRLAPDYITPRLELARTYVELDRRSEALEQLEAALDLAPREQLDRLQLEQAAALLEEIRD